MICGNNYTKHRNIYCIWIKSVLWDLVIVYNSLYTPGELWHFHSLHMEFLFKGELGFWLYVKPKVCDCKNFIKLSRRESGKEGGEEASVGSILVL